MSDARDDDPAVTHRRAPALPVSIAAEPPGVITQGAGYLSILGPPPRPGLLGVIDHFEIVKLLGRGGMGVVYLARDVVTSATVAIKVLAGPAAQDQRAVRRFLTEAASMARLSHRAILPVFSVSSDPAKPYYVMRFIEPGPLSSLIRPGTPLPGRTIIGLATDIAEALVEVHRRGLSHRDLKPANVLVDGEGHAYLADFGLVRSFVHDSLADGGEFGCEGTAPYMSPMTASGQAEDTRSDIYSFGALLYEMLTGSAPYSGPNTLAVLSEIRAGPPVPILQRNPAAPAGLAAIAEGAMARELRDRYAQAADVVADLKRVAAGQTPLGSRSQASGAHTGAVGFMLAGAAVLALAIACVLAWKLIPRHTGTISQQTPSPPASLVPTYSPVPAHSADMPAPMTTAVDPSGAARMFIADQGDTGGNRDLISCIAFSPDGQRAASGGRDKILRLWDVKTGRQLLVFAAITGDTSHDDTINSVAFSADGTRVASASDDQTVKIWDAHTGRRLYSMASPAATQPADPAAVRQYLGVAFWADANNLAMSVDRIGELQSWDSSLGVQLRSVPIIAGPLKPRRLAMAARGEVFAWSEPPDLRLHVVVTGAAREIAVLSGARDSISLIAFSADGRYVAAATEPGDQPIAIRIWDVQKNEEVQHIPGRSGLARAIALSGDGRLIAAAGTDIDSHGGCAVRAWDVQSRKLLWESPLLAEQQMAIAFSPDGQAILSADHTRVLRLWSLPSQHARP